MGHGTIKAKRIDNCEWVEGNLLKLKTDNLSSKDGYIYYIIPEISNSSWCIENLALKVISPCYEVDPSTICRYAGKKYMDWASAYEGDIFESQASGDLMILRYGIYQAYCPVDRVYMDSVGFYAECSGYPNMPIGDLSDYALKKGNIFDSPGLLTGRK